MDFLKRPPSPCNVDFEGANVIVGKSLIRRGNKSVKLNIKFNDDMIKLFEYPSEASLLEEKFKPSGQMDQNISLDSHAGGFSNYTPSKVNFEGSFELGSRPIVITSLEPTAPANEQPIDSEVQDENYLKPAEEKTTWSAETTSVDLLF